MKGKEQCQCVGLDPDSRAAKILSVLTQSWAESQGQEIASLQVVNDRTGKTVYDSTASAVELAGKG